MSEGRAERHETESTPPTPPGREAIKILFLGDFWLGADARGFKDALARHPEVHVDEIDFGHYVPYTLDRRLQLAYRLLRGRQSADMEAAIRTRLDGFRPDAVVVFKGAPLRPGFLREMQGRGLPVVCIFPDKSPRQFGADLGEAMGLYDLVISTKAAHPGDWGPVYGYANRCVHVAHGYAPETHLDMRPVTDPDHDITMVASWRPRYEALLADLAARLGDAGLSVAICGGNWDRRRLDAPEGWHFHPGQLGRAYTEWLRRGRIVLAPVETEFEQNGRTVPGDQVTARSYQCAAALVFFLHPRTPEVQRLYDEGAEVAMFSDADELAAKIRHYLDRPEERAAMAAAAHARAVPAYSHDARASEILGHLRGLIARRAPGPGGG